MDERSSGCGSRSDRDGLRRRDTDRRSACGSGQCCGKRGGDGGSTE